MSQTRRALITGITGQDGSYLADLLLEKGYDVHGMVRRSSTEAFERLQHIREDITLHTGDLLDERSLVDVLRTCEPHEVYNLAAMSFVAASWNQPVLTAEFSGVGVTRILEAVREVAPEARFYQASSSEMFGKVRQTPQSESTPFYPRSPYGVAKAYGHFITVNYRESYELFAVSGILFNHECISEQTPLIVRRDGIVSVETPASLIPLRRKGASTQTFTPSEFLEVWDGQDWATIGAITATRRRSTDPDHEMLSIEGRAGIVQTTAHHKVLLDGGDPIEAREVQEQDSLELTSSFPEPLEWAVATEELGELLGLLVADGYISPEGAVRFVNNDRRLQIRVTELWSRLFLGVASGGSGRSGWDPKRTVERVDLQGARQAGRWTREQIYTSDGFKRVPPLVLNSDRQVRGAFLRGYYLGDGLKRGKGDSVKTNSAVLAQGLCWLYALEGRECSVYAEQREQAVYYQLNVRTAVPVGAKGQHLARSPSEVRRVERIVAPSEWVFDLETESGRFCAGIGRAVVHNSPRRGLEFVTRKVTHAAAAIKLGLQDKLLLGNLDARRDWGYAKDYVEAMWLMLQQDEPEDYVVATGKAHTVGELVELAFSHLDLDPEQYVGTDPRFLRPAEVEHLVGDASKAREKLGWEPRTSFEELVRLMVDSDLELLSSGVPQKQAG